MELELALTPKKLVFSHSGKNLQVMKAKTSKKTLILRIRCLICTEYEMITPSYSYLRNKLNFEIGENWES